MRRLRSAAAVAGVLLLAGCSSAPAVDAPAAVPAPGPAVEPPPPRTPPPTVDEQAAAIVSGMTRSERAGQVLMTAGTVPQLRSLAPLVRDHHLSGVMVRGRSGAGAAAVRSALGPARAAAPSGLPLITATDQEGGTVQVLTGPGFSAIPGAVAQTGRPTAALERDARGWGDALAAAGVRLDLGPVADVPCAATRNDNPPIAALGRNYGMDPTRAGVQVAAVVRGLGSAGVQSAIKHFPGLGCVTANTDTAAHVVDGATDGGSARLRPFAAGIDAGAGFVMVSSASYARIDPGIPALFSTRVVTGMLRSRMGFGGVVMSDDTGGAAALRAWTPAQRATRFVSAGGDLLLDIVPSHVPAIHQALVHRASADPRFDDSLRTAATRVVAARLRLAE